MKHYKLPTVIFLLIFCFASYAQNYQFLVLKASQGIVIDGHLVNQENKYDTIYLNSKIDWPNNNAKITLLALDTFQLFDKESKEIKSWNKDIDKEIKCTKASETDLRNHNLYWWIKYNMTSTKALGELYFDQYVEYLVNDTIVIDCFSYPIDDEHQYTLRYRNNNNEKIVVKATQFDNTSDFFFTKKQLEDNGFFEAQRDKRILEIWYNDEVVIDYFDIKEE